METSDQAAKQFEMFIAFLSVVMILTAGMTAAISDPGIENDESSKPYSPSSQPDGLMLETVDREGDVGKYTSLEIQKGKIYVSYYSKSDHNLKLAKKKIGSSGWKVWRVEKKGNVGEFSSLEVSEGGNAHISYYDRTEQELKYAVWYESKENSIVTVDSFGDVGKYSSLELDEDGKPHISYYDASKGDLKYAVKEDSYWDTETAVSQGDVGRYASLALHDSEPHVSFYDWENRDLMYAEKDNDSWSSRKIEQAGELAGKYTSIEIDEEGYAHITCYEWTDSDHSLKYLTNSNDEKWEAEEVDGSSDYIGTYTSLELVDGKPVISYHEWDEKNLKLAGKDESGEWKIENMDSQYRVGSCSSLDTVNEGEVHVSYYDQTHDDLKHARYFLHNTTPLAPESFETRSEYGEILLDWDSPRFDGIKDGKYSISGYNLYRSDGSGFQLLEKNLSASSYTDDIPTEKESKTYRYRVAAINRIGVGRNSTTIETKARYFNYKKMGSMTNRYEIEELLQIGTEDSPDSYTIRWDFDYDGNAEWDEISHSARMNHEYEDVGLKNVLLEIENGAGKKRRYLQTAWVVGNISLTSTYEIEGSNEIFFSIPETGLNHLDFPWTETSLKNTYVLKGPQDLPYRYIEFDFLGEEYSKGKNEKEKRLEPEAVDEDGRALWNQTLDVSDAEEDTEVTAEVYLYNEYRETIERPFERSESGKPELKKEVEVISTPDWFHPVLDLVGKKYLTVENEGENGYYYGWNVTMEVPSSGDIESANISSISDTGLNKMDKFFGGEYGFTLNLFPEGDIELSNDPESFGIETTLFRYEKGTSNKKNRSGSLGDSFGKAMEYAGEVKKEVTVGIAVKLRIDRSGIEVRGVLELGLKAEIKIDVPLYHIGIADVGLTAEVGGGIGVTFEMGGLSYGKEKGIAPEPPGQEQIPVELGVNFGGGPYGEAGEGLARVEGKFLMDLGVGIEIPSMSKEFSLGGRFEVAVEALYGLWKKSWSWELFSKTFNSAVMNDMKIEDPTTDKSFTLDRLFTRDYDNGLNKDLRAGSSDYHTELEDNVGPRSSPQIAFVNDSNGLAVWSSLSKNSDGNVQSDLYMSRYDGSGWTEGEKIKETENKTEYDPELVKYDDNGEKKIALMFSEVQSDISGSEDIQEFYENNSIRCFSWSPEKGSWENTGLEHSVEGESITRFDVDANAAGELYTVYRTGNVSLDIFNGSLTEEGTIGALKGDLSSKTWTEEMRFNKNNLSSGSSPSIGSADGKAALLYSTTEKTAEEDPYLNRTVLVEVNGGEKHELEKTANSTSFTLLSNKSGDLIVSWVENRTTIMRKEVDLSDSWNISEVEEVYEGRTMSGLDHRVNESGEFYTFQSGKDAVPKIIRSKGDGWGYLRSVSKDRAYGQVDYEFATNTPKMIVTEKEDVISSWHSARYTFDGLNGGHVKDQSEESNDGELIGNYSREKSGLDGYGRFVELKGEEQKMKVDHADSLNLTEENEDLTITSLVEVEEKSDGYLMEKNGSWAVKHEDGKLLIELWNGSGKHTTKINDLTVPTDRWLFLGIRYEHSASGIYLNVTLANKTDEVKNLFSDRTVRYRLDGFDSLNSSNEPIVFGDYPGRLKFDDVRFVKRYLPDASVKEIYDSAYPNFEPKYSISTQNIPPYVNFTSLDDKVVGKPINFKGESLSSNLNWTWTFQNGERRYGKSIDYTFNESGYHTVKLGVEHNVTGARSSCYRTYQIIDVDPPGFEDVQNLTKLGNGSVELDWKDAEGESEPFEYRVHHVKGEGAELNTRYWVDSTENTSIVLDDLEPDIKHHVKVTVRNEVGLINSSSSSVTFELEDTSPPEFKGLISAYTVDQANRTVRLRWERAEDDSENVYYKVYHSKGKENLDFNSSFASVENRNVVDIKVNEIGKHRFAVRAEDQNGNIDLNQVVKTVKVRDVSAPLINITNSPSKEIVRSQFTLEWKGEDDQSGISEYWVKTDYNGWEKVDKDTTSFTFLNLPDGERRLTVKAVDGENNTASDSINLTVRPNSVPEFEIISPRNGTEGLSTDVTLKTKVRDGDDHTVDVRFVSGEGKLIEEKTNISSGSNVSAVWRGLEKGETYRWKIVIDDGYSTTSSELHTFSTEDDEDDSEKENSPPEKPENVYPKDGKEDLGSNVTLSVTVYDEDGDAVNVSFYENDSGELIGSVSSVKSGDEASVYWKGLQRNTTYAWYAVADDGTNRTRSSVWQFSTVGESQNAFPKRPINPLPEDEGENLGTNISLSVDVFDSDDVILDVSFYNADGDQLIGTEKGVESGTNAGLNWRGLERNRTYRWYAVSNDGENETESEVWKFSTAPKEQNAHPKRPVDPSPEDGSRDLGTNVTLSVEVFDSDDDTLDVTFYDAGSNQMIDSIEDVKSGSTVRAEWEDLERNSSYRWYAVSSDGEKETGSEMWSFTTAAKKQNSLPKKPSEPSPKDGADGVGTNVTLSVRVQDPDGDLLKVSFYNAENGRSLGTVERVESGTTVSLDWDDLEENSTYSWYVEIGDGNGTIKSEEWSFSTIEDGGNDPNKDEQKTDDTKEAGGMISPIQIGLILVLVGLIAAILTLYYKSDRDLLW